MTDEQMLEKFGIVLMTVTHLAQAIIIEYAISKDKSEIAKNECRQFIDVCAPLDRVLTSGQKIPANNESLAMALDVLLKAQECIKNQKVFGKTHSTLIKISTDLTISSIKKLAIALDHRNK